MPKFVIATVAEKGGGKGLFTGLAKKLLSKQHIVSLRLSDIFRTILGILGKEESRHNISTLSTALRQGFQDDGILIPAMKKRITETDADIIVLDGIRKPEEVKPLIRDFGGILVYIEASQKVRFKRRRAHAETTDEKDMAWEQFVRQDQMAAEVSIRTIGETMADVTIENNGTAEEFEEKIKKFLEERVIPKLS